MPSYNVNQQPISADATFIRPANLRGMPSDATLVLVNGKRRHRAAVVALSADGVNHGTQGADLSVIPTIALERVEVLRDGAAAQYGSDAIAGILNFKLKEASEGLSLHTSWGQTYHGDGDKVNVAANLGLPLTDNGFANFSFEFLNADETGRSVQRNDARGLIEAGNRHVRRPAAQIWGAPEIQYDYKFFGNLGLDLEALDARLYAFGNYAERRGGERLLSSVIPTHAAGYSGATRSKTGRPPSEWPTCPAPAWAVPPCPPIRRPTTPA